MASLNHPVESNLSPKIAVKTINKLINPKTSSGQVLLGGRSLSKTYREAGGRPGVQQLIRRHLGVSISPCGGVTGHRSLHINYGKYSARSGDGDGPRSIATTSPGLTKQRLVERPRPRTGPHTRSGVSGPRARQQAPHNRIKQMWSLHHPSALCRAFYPPSLTRSGRHPV